MEMETKVADSLYFHDADSLYVNLFIASELDWRERALRVTQVTAFPASDATTLIFATDRPQRLALKIRRPAWVESLPITVNGQPVDARADTTSYVTIEREWHDGDQVNVRLPLTVRAVPLPEAPTLVAFMYGPLVLAGDLGDAGLRFKPRAFVDNGKDPRGPRVAESPEFVPGLVANVAEVASHVRAIAGEPLVFQTNGIGRPHDVTLRPLYQIAEQSYTVYWQLYDTVGWQEFWRAQWPAVEKRKAALARVVDAVWAGLPESEQAHAIAAGLAPIVSSRLSLFRDATHGWVSWKLRSPGDQDAVLRVGYLGGDQAAFDLFVNDNLVASERPASPAPSTPNRATVTTLKTYPLPAALTHNESLVTIRVVGHPDQGSARIVFCELSRR
jgi:hypothetical protein